MTQIGLNRALQPWMLALMSVTGSRAGLCTTPYGASNAGAKPSPLSVQKQPAVDGAAAGTTRIVPSGTILRVRLDQKIDTVHNHPGDRFTGRLIAPVSIGDQALLPKGSVVWGIVAESRPSGRLHHRGVLTLVLRSIELNGRNVPVSTGGVTRLTGSHKKRNFALIGGGSGLGALIGGVATGGSGALIGAGAGATAGTVGAYFTGKKHVRMLAESLLSFRLRQPLKV
jgi:hypothetical protein